MAPRFAPQSRMPTLLPQKTDVLWYPRERDVEHMDDELAQEEKDFASKLKGIRFSGTHFIPAGLSKPFMDMEEEEEEEGEDDDDGDDDEEEEEEDEDGEGEEEEGEDDLDMARDLDDEIGEEEEEEQEEEEHPNNRSMEFYHGGDMDLELRASFDDGDDEMMMGILGRQVSIPDINELDDFDDDGANDLDHYPRSGQQSFRFNSHPTTRYHIDDDHDNNIDNINDDEDGINHHHMHHLRRRPQEPYINQDHNLGGHHRDDQEDIDGWLQQQQQQLQEEEQEGYEEHDLDADIEVASSFGAGGGGSDYEHDDDCRLYPSTPHRTPSPQNDTK